jgi:hypothetical protein
MHLFCINYLCVNASIVLYFNVVLLEFHCVGSVMTAKQLSSTVVSIVFSFMYLAEPPWNDDESGNSLQGLSRVYSCQLSAGSDESWWNFFARLIGNTQSILINCLSALVSLGHEKTLMETLASHQLSSLFDQGLSSFHYSAYDSCRDESMLSLHEKCSQLEDHNTCLILEVWNIDLFSLTWDLMGLAVFQTDKWKDILTGSYQTMKY